MTQAKIVLGTWAWGDNNSYFGNDYDQAHFKEIFDEAVKQGLNFWDTALAYGYGASEKLLGNLSQDFDRSDLVLSTKFTPQMQDGSDNAVQNMFEGSLDRLKTDYIDYYWIHNDADVEKWTPELIPLLKSGKVKHVGVSNHTLSEIKRVQEILGEAGYKLDAVQNHLSLLDRTSEQAGILDYCRENDITFFAYMILEQGALSGKYDINHPFPEGSVRAQVYNSKLPELTKLIDTLREVGESHDLSVAQTAMSWAVSKGVLPIIGVTKIHQVQDAAQVSSVQLSDEEIQRLEQVADQAGVNTIGSWEQDMTQDK
ncbi:MAG: aldo/keto reductase [Limosilactobacillus sp.]|uniref:aldo/keto reductase n=1 Tax=Limosilactobacillus sp. TaxID=2773925 RepID=UPI002708664E|nr:aldo/keto reductase [Limosilactobacillus sp.]